MNQKSKEALKKKEIKARRGIDRETGRSRVISAHMYGSAKN